MGIFRLTWSDPYGKDDGEAGYVHTMAIRSEMHGQNLGEAILKMVGSEVRQEGKQFLRLDYLASNDRLRLHYKERGFVYRSEITNRDYEGALYEKPA